MALAAEEATAATKRLKSARHAAPSPAVSADVTRIPQATSQSVKVAKTGMVLARARVFDAASGVVAARERRTALIGKGTYRDSEMVGSEAPVGSLSTKDMPKRKEAVSGGDFSAKFKSWMQVSLTAKVYVPLYLVSGEGQETGARALSDCRMCLQVKQQQGGPGPPEGAAVSKLMLWHDSADAGWWPRW